MHKSIFVSAFLFYFPFCEILAQTPQEIIQRHESLTGMTARQKIRTLTSIGRITQMGSTVPVSIIQKRPNKYRLDVHLAEGRITQAYDGISGWVCNPFVSPDTLPLDGPALGQLRESADFDGILHTYRTKGYTATIAEKVKLGAQTAYKIRLNKPGGESMTFYVDAVTFFVVRSEADLLIDGMAYQAESTFGDFRKVAGMILPYFIQTRNGMLFTEIRIDTVRVNEQMEDRYFIWRSRK
jgi:hypothetical protein